MPPNIGVRPLFELAYLANNVEVLNKREFSKSNQLSQEKIQKYKDFWKKNSKIEGKKILLESVCFNIYQRYDVKLGILLSLIGGVN